MTRISLGKSILGIRIGATRLKKKTNLRRGSEENDGLRLSQEHSAKPNAPPPRNFSNGGGLERIRQRDTVMPR